MLELCPIFKGKYSTFKLGPIAIIGRGTAITKGLRLAESQPQEHSKTTMIHNYITVVP